MTEKPTADMMTPLAILVETGDLSLQDCERIEQASEAEMDDVLHSICLKSAVVGRVMMKNGFPLAAMTKLYLIAIEVSRERQLAVIN